MTTLFMLDVPENTPIVAVADEAATVTVDRVGPYFRLTSDEEIVIDRRATGCRHAVWYSSIAGLLASSIAQWDKDALRVQPTAGHEEVAPDHSQPDAEWVDAG
ncbi:hypothetical protein [Gordonia sp. (in: high G+C Gram-positive bacteria)]|uniref:hypothetical protein n=1 Tax=Gordonia sp. (in: high G+C Gram-positive bacteria) TaxID=84139 RepID=UPI0026142CE7|nr:hypothetical protein [Gordonia sp. (in: high G+C Gram-positive bacteria)]